MKKTLFLCGTTMALVPIMSLTSCTTKEDVPAKPKNYYGVEQEGNGAPKEAYIALFLGIVGVCLLVAWGLKKLSSKR
jgi:hypothetical protein